LGALCRIIFGTVKATITVRVLGILLILLGSTWYYLQGHKDNGLIVGLSYLLVFLGWILVSLSAVGRFILKESVTFSKGRVKWIKTKVTSAIIYFSIAGLAIANMILLGNLIDKRVHNILTSDPTNVTTGLITELENRNTRDGSKEYAIIQYSADGKDVQQAIFNYKGQYFVGQKFEVEYSIDNPEMFQLKREFVKK
jgi:hypothetical protein